MEKFKIEFLGDRHICLEEQNNTIKERIHNCNLLINLIASLDRKFLSCYDGFGNAKFTVIDNKLIYIDHYNNNPIRNTHKEDLYKWKGQFTSGGTLQHLVMCFSIYIKSGIPFFLWHARLNDWGYSSSGVDSIKDKGLELGIFTQIERYMFWMHGKNSIDKIEPYLEAHPDIKKDKCITVLSENNKRNQYWLGEFNFKYIGI